MPRPRSGRCKPRWKKLALSFFQPARKAAQAFASSWSGALPSALGEGVNELTSATEQQAFETVSINVSLRGDSRVDLSRRETALDSKHEAPRAPKSKRIPANAFHHASGEGGTACRRSFHRL